MVGLAILLWSMIVCIKALKSIVLGSIQGFLDTKVPERIHCRTTILNPYFYPRGIECRKITLCHLFDEEMNIYFVLTIISPKWWLMYVHSGSWVDATTKHTHTQKSISQVNIWENQMFCFFLYFPFCFIIIIPLW